MNNFKYVDEREFQKIYEEEIVGDRVNAVLVLTVYFGQHNKKFAETKDPRVTHAYQLHKKMREQFAERVTCPIYIVDITKSEHITDVNLCVQFEVNRIHQLPCIILFKDGKMIERHFSAGSDGEYLDGIIQQIKKL